MVSESEVRFEIEMKNLFDIENAQLAETEALLEMPKTRRQANYQIFYFTRSFTKAKRK